jgi:hypothetical protein
MNHHEQIYNGLRHHFHRGEPERLFLSWVLLFPKAGKGPAPFCRAGPLFLRPFQPTKVRPMSLEWAGPKELAHPRFSGW